MKQNRIVKFAGPGLQHLRMCISKFTAQQNDISSEILKTLMQNCAETSERCAIITE